MRLFLIMIVAFVTACRDEPGQSVAAIPAGIEVPQYPELEQRLIVAEEPVNWADPRSARPEPYEWQWQHYRVEDWRDFPRDIQLLLQRETKENSRCRGGSGGNRSTWRACNRRDIVLTELMKLGWCWGGSHTEALKHWLRCADDPDYRPNTLSQVQSPYMSEQEMNEFYEDEPAAFAVE